MSLINVKFLRSWGSYNAGECAGFTAEALAERINVGGGPEQQLRIPRDCYVAGNEEAAAALADLFPPVASTVNVPAGHATAAARFAELAEEPAEKSAEAPADATPTPAAS